MDLCFLFGRPWSRKQRFSAKQLNMPDRFSKSCASEIFPNQGVLSDLLCGRVKDTSPGALVVLPGRRPRMPRPPRGSRRRWMMIQMVRNSCGGTQRAMWLWDMLGPWGSGGNFCWWVEVLEFNNDDWWYKCFKSWHVWLHLWNWKLLLTFQFSSPFCQTWGNKTSWSRPVKLFGKPRELSFDKLGRRILRILGFSNLRSTTWAHITKQVSKQASKQV